MDAQESGSYYLSLTDLLDLDNLQQIQDAFAEVNSVASVITDTLGKPLTRPSNFCALCLKIRQTPRGISNCEMSDKILGEKALAAMRPAYEKCKSCGLLDASAPIVVDGKHIANWLIGQIKTKDSNRGDILRCAEETGADADGMLEAFDDVKMMSTEHFEKVINLLWCIAREISTLGYNNLKLVQEITERKKNEQHLEFLSTHDALTGLYNRHYFEKTVVAMNGKRTGMGVIVCDVDGLKLVNDTMGHSAGDTLLIATAEIIKKVVGNQGVSARIGGDEFAVLLPGFSREQTDTIGKALRVELIHYNLKENGLHLSISVGTAAAGKNTAADGYGLFKEADNNMYREKLHRGQSARSALVQTVMKLLEARDFITEGHCERLQSSVTGLGRALGLSEQKLSDLRLLAQFHDIGKVGIPERILFKQGPLTPEERTEMQRHSEIGHRIALSSPDLAHIADWILKHHEWWDGRGYPLQITGKEIPLECRILSIADAYDAMVSNRPYRLAMPNFAAISEIQRCAGTQFDPALVKKFAEING